MLADLIRAAVQLVMRDKIVAGIVIVAILGIFFCGVNNKDKGGHRFISKQGQEAGQEEGGEGQEGSDKEPEGGQSQPQAQGQGQGPGQGQGKGQAATTLQPGSTAGQQGTAGQAGTGTAKLAPSLAMDFVRWWLTMALDYSTTAPANHKKAMSYSKPHVAKLFSQSFYTPEVMQGIANGTLAGSFQPATVQAVAVNPDGSVVVTVIGTLSMQSSGSQPVSQSLIMDFAVSKDAEGVRMAGFFNKTVSQAPAQQEAQPTEAPQPMGQ